MPEGIPYSSANIVVGTGLELNYIGEHCYAYSGGKGSTENEQTYLLFTSGNATIVGELTVSGGVEFSGPTVGVTSAWKLQMNGIVVGLYKTDTIEEDQPPAIVVPIIIPPYTLVQVSAYTSDNNSDKLNSCSILGRLYK
jgi:hypothetical protein